MRMNARVSNGSTINACADITARSPAMPPPSCQDPKNCRPLIYRNRARGVGSAGLLPDRHLRHDAVLAVGHQSPRLIYDSAAGFFAFRRKVNRPVLASDGGNEKIHESVAVRLQAVPTEGSYRPPSLANGLRTESLAVFGGVERELRWSAPNRAQSGLTSPASPSLVDRMMRDIGGG